MIRRIPLLLAGATVIAGAWACDSLSDPEKPATPASPDASTDASTNTEHVAGALTGDVPAEAHVAIVWRSEQGLTLGADAPVVGGHFSIGLAPPPDELLTDKNGFANAGHPETFTDWWSAIDASSLHVQTDVNGSVTDGQQPLRFAYAGFIVYVDTNGNGKLDFDKAGTAGDTLVGGSESFALVYYRGGGSLDYESLRGANGAAPHEGYNLRFGVGADHYQDGTDRWLPLDQVQLQPGPTPMPRRVCGQMASQLGIPTHFADDAGVHIECSANGEQYVFVACSMQDEAKALCWSVAFDQGHTNCAASEAIPRGTSPPADWPCPAADAGNEAGP